MEVENLKWAVTELKEEVSNLSSEIEALRLLIADLTQQLKKI